MEGNYYFVWYAVAATGAIEGRHEQTIYGKTLAAAIDQFTAFHGDLTPNDSFLLRYLFFGAIKNHQEEKYNDLQAPGNL